MKLFWEILITSFARMQISYTGVLFFLVQDYFVFFKTRKKSCSLAEEKSHASYTGHIFSYTGETISPTQEKLFLLHRRSLPFPSSSKVQSFSLHRPSWHRVSTYKLEECILRDGKWCVKTTTMFGGLGQRTSKIFISVHPSQGWIDQVKLTEFLSHVELWLHFPGTSRSCSFEFHI